MFMRPIVSKRDETRSLLIWILSKVRSSDQCIKERTHEIFIVVALRNLFWGTISKYTMDLFVGYLRIPYIGISKFPKGFPSQGTHFPLKIPPNKTPIPPIPLRFPLIHSKPSHRMSLKKKKKTLITYNYKGPTVVNCKDEIVNHYIY